MNPQRPPNSVCLPLCSNIQWTSVGNYQGSSTGTSCQRLLYLVLHHLMPLKKSYYFLPYAHKGGNDWFSQFPFFYLQGRAYLTCLPPSPKAEMQHCETAWLNLFLRKGWWWSHITWDSPLVQNQPTSLLIASITAGLLYTAELIRLISLGQYFRLQFLIFRHFHCIYYMVMNFIM